MVHVTASMVHVTNLTPPESGSTQVGRTVKTHQLMTAGVVYGRESADIGGDLHVESS
jgi:hypothetical protein